MALATKNMYDYLTKSMDKEFHKLFGGGSDTSLTSAVVEAAPPLTLKTLTDLAEDLKSVPKIPVIKVSKHAMKDGKPAVLRLRIPDGIGLWDEPETYIIHPDFIDVKN